MLSLFVFCSTGYTHKYLSLRDNSAAGLKVFTGISKEDIRRNHYFIYIYFFLYSFLLPVGICHTLKYPNYCFNVCFYVCLLLFFSSSFG